MDDKKDIIVLDDVKKIQYDFDLYEIKDEYIKNIEKIVRSSIHLKDLFIFIKNTMKIDQCAYYEGISIKNGYSIELHHHPLTLYDIVNVICNKHLKLNGFYDEDGVAEEVVLVHFRLIVGLIPLSKTAHNAYHSKGFKIHPKQVIFDWMTFEKEYNEFLNDDIKNKLIQFHNESEDDNVIFPEILKRYQTLIEVPEFSKLSLDKIDDLLVDYKLAEIDKLPILEKK